jgi:hypothetical protein
MFNKQVNERIDRSGMIINNLKKQLFDTRLILKDLLKYMGLVHKRETKMGMINGHFTMEERSGIEKMTNKVSRSKKVTK